MKIAQTPISFIQLSKHKQAGFIMTNSIGVTFPAMVKLTNFAMEDKNVTAIYAAGYEECK